jgi:hypothetical protein
METGCYRSLFFFKRRYKMRNTASKHKQVLIDHLTAAREDLLTVIRQLPAGSLNQPCIGTWCVKDLVAHLVGWDFTNLRAAQEILAGQRPSFFQYYDADWHSYNARLVETYRREPFEALLAEASSSRGQLIAFLQSMSPQQILEGKSPKEQGRTITIRNLLRSEAEDERKHCAQVRAFLAAVLT